MDRDFTPFVQQPRECESTDEWLGTSSGHLVVLDEPANEAREEHTSPAEESFEETRPALSPTARAESMLGAFGHYAEGLGRASGDPDAGSAEACPGGSDGDGLTGDGGYAQASGEAGPHIDLGGDATELDDGDLPEDVGALDAVTDVYDDDTSGDDDEPDSPVELGGGGSDDGDEGAGDAAGLDATEDLAEGAVVADGADADLSAAQRATYGADSGGDTAGSAGGIELLQVPSGESSGEVDGPGSTAQSPSSAAMGDASNIQSVAAHGVQGASGTLPHLDAIQSSFGAHDVSGVQCRVGGAAADAADAMGANAYAIGNRIGFGNDPSVFTAAHEAAHVVQQRAGVQLLGGVGEVGDVYEQNADEVAGAVERGEPAAHLLGSAARSSHVAMGGVQREQRNNAGAVGTNKAGRRARIRRQFLRLIRRRMPSHSQGRQRRAFAIARRRTQLLDWVSALPSADARTLALQLRPGGSLSEDFKGQLATSERREIRALLGGMVALPGADGQSRTGVGTSIQGVDDSTLIDRGAKGREDEFVPSGNLAVQVGQSHFRLWGFDVNSAVVRAEYSDCLRTVAQLVEGDQKAKIQLEGHTSGSGPEANNAALGSTRAMSIAAALVGRGVAPPRITTSGRGSSAPLVRTKRNPSAMARNRRVEIRWQLSRAQPEPQSKKAPVGPGFPRIKQVLAGQPKSFWQQSALCMLDKYDTLGADVDDAYIGGATLWSRSRRIVGEFPATAAEVESNFVMHMRPHLVRMERMRDASIVAGMRHTIRDARKGISLVNRRLVTDGVAVSPGYMRIAKWINTKLTDPRTVLSCFH